MALLQDLGHSLAGLKLLAGCRVQVGAELREGRQGPEAGQIEAEATGDLTHRLDLRGATDTGDGKTGVHRRADAGVEEVRLQVDLAVGDGDDVGRDVGRNVAGLRLDHRQAGERTTAQVVREAGGALQQPGVQVEDIAGVGLAAGRAAHQQGDLTIRLGMLGKVVVDDQGVAARLHELFAHGGPGEGGDELEGGRVGGGCGDHDGVVHRAVLFQDPHRLRNLGPLQPDGDVDADYAAGLLIDDRVEDDCGLADLTVADDQLSLAATDGDHRVNGLDAGLERRIDVLTGNHARRDPLDRAGPVRSDRALAIDGAAEGIDDATNQGVTDGHRRDPSSGADFVAFLDVGVLAEDDDPDAVLLEVERQTEGLGLGELDEFAGHHLGEAVDGGDAVTDAHHGADVGHRHLVVGPGDQALQVGNNFAGIHRHGVESSHGPWAGYRERVQRRGASGSPPRLSLGGSGQPRTQATELADHAAVDQHVANPSHHPADDLGVGPHLKFDVLTDDALELVSHELLLGRRQRLGGRHVGHRDTLRVQSRLGVGANDVGHDIESIALRQNANEIADFRLGTG